MAGKEYGGYIELDVYRGEEYHNNAVAFNCCRNCLAYLIEVRNIEKIYLPYFLCNSVVGTCKKRGIEIKYYHVDQSLRPIIDFKINSNEWIYIVNYYGQLSDGEIIKYKKLYDKIIIDNAQAFFQMPISGIDTFYNCRKFFGVADGAYLYTDAIFKGELEQDYSFNRMNFLLGRFEKRASDFYSEYVSNEEMFLNEPIKKMSKLTHNLLCAIDYNYVKRVRTDNFKYLQEHYAKVNKLKLAVPEGAFMYPLYFKNGGDIREILQKEKIYIPTLWPNVIQSCGPDDLEFDLAKNILPLPIDQRYVIADMKYICNRIDDLLKRL